MKAVLFDLDGTLVDSSEGITKCVQYALARFGIDEPDRERLTPFIGPPLSESFMKYYGFSREQALTAVSVYRERYQTIGIYECSLYPGVRECLRRLREQGLRIGMASSKPEASCRIILDHFGILELFDDVVGATMDGSIGTKEEVLREVMRRWPGLSADELCLVGDTSYDVEGAGLVGISCVAVSYGFGDVGQMRDLGAVAVCPDMRSLPSVIGELARTNVQSMECI